MRYEIYQGDSLCASYEDMNSISIWLEGAHHYLHVKVFNANELIDTVRSRDWPAYVDRNRDNPKHTMYSPTFGMYIKE